MKKAIFFTFILFVSCEAEPHVDLKCFKVSATAYNSIPYQTRPGTLGNIAAWGDTLKPGMKSIAVSRDLLDSGLTKHSKVLIEGFQGDTFLVLDKMHYRFKRRIDLYMGLDVQKAKEFGFQKRWICLIQEESVGNEN
ncbi:MAG: 3D domain-containing protein [Flavobacteriales bacterium]|nr:3D domain-containing protein [Flavobacteriales bacterium]